MSIQVEKQPCWLATCDRCDESYPGDGELGICHFADEQEAREAIESAGWFTASDGTLICFTCADDGPFWEVTCPACGSPPETSCAGERRFCDERIEALAQTLKSTQILGSEGRAS